MAEGGDQPGEDGKENPFSFKKFVEKSNSPDSRSPGSEEDEELSSAIPDLRPEARPKKKTIILADDEKPKRKDENPFSFKKFLQSNSGGGARPKVATNGPFREPGSGATSNRGGDLSNLDLANDLPEFIQHHFVDDCRRPRNEVPLPDFALDSGGSPKTCFDPPPPPLGPSPAEFRPINPLPHDGGARPRISQPYRPHSGHSHHSMSPGPRVSPFQNGISDEEDDMDFIQPTANTTGCLPDFLSDSAVGSRDIDDLPSGDLESELRQVREDNKQLRKQLEEARQFAETESRRVVDVMAEMEAIQKREADDTKSLENMVQQVEANLVATTQRAVKAESTVSKLRQEVSSLQAQLQTVQLENQAINNGQAPSDIVREKAKYASEQVAAAAQTAEHRIKELLTGVETLRLVSQVLASIDKIDTLPNEAKSSDVPDESRSQPSHEDEDAHDNT